MTFATFEDYINNTPNRGKFPGSKTYFLDYTFDHDKCKDFVEFDPDNIKEQIFEYMDTKYGQNTWAINNIVKLN